MNSPKSNKFKVGDKVKAISRKNTVKRFGGDSDDLAEIGTEGIVNNVTGECVGIEGNMWLLDVDDVILLDKTESVNDIKIGDSVEFFGVWCNWRYVTYRDWETDRKSTRLNSSHRL